MSEKVVENVDAENSITMVDVLLEENQLEEDAHAVLGASDDKNCTYSKGYIRQALYACKTCCSKNVRAAICLACSLHCHEGHELIELYTKRHVRCDCGNSKFEDKKCTLDTTKTSVNIENAYNHNYDGVYCVCARPYPDPENITNDEMLQCIICEDWYHSKHLECDTNIPEENAYSEMICMGCMKNHQFLWKYASILSVKNNSKSTENKEPVVEVEKSIDHCTMPKDEGHLVDTKGSCFWVEGWRNALCTCVACKTMYKEQNILYLLDRLDSVQAYEEAGQLNQRESQYEKGMKALASLDRVQQLNAIEEYNNMKEQLKKYLQKFAENKKVVREEDIKEFFSGMESKKRPKIVVPTFCR